MHSLAAKYDKTLTRLAEDCKAVASEAAERDAEEITVQRSREQALAAQAAAEEEQAQFDEQVWLHLTGTLLPTPKHSLVQDPPPAPSPPKGRALPPLCRTPQGRSWCAACPCCSIWPGNTRQHSTRYEVMRCLTVLGVMVGVLTCGSVQGFHKGRFRVPTACPLPLFDVFKEHYVVYLMLLLTASSEGHLTLLNAHKLWSINMCGSVRKCRCTQLSRPKSKRLHPACKLSWTV